MHLSSGQVSVCFRCPTFNFPLGKLERTERTSVLYSFSRKNVERDDVLNVYLSFGWVNTNSHLSHRQNNLSQMSGHHIFRILSVPRNKKRMAKTWNPLDLKFFHYYMKLSVSRFRVPVFSILTLSLAKANLTKPRKLLNPEQSNEIWRCDHSNESSWWVLSNGGVHDVAEQSLCFCKFYV